MNLKTKIGLQVRIGFFFSSINWLTRVFSEIPANHFCMCATLSICGAVAHSVRHRIRDREVVGSSLTGYCCIVTLGKLFTLRASVTEMYNLVPA